MLSCHLFLLILCDSLVFWILSCDCTFCLIAWYLYMFYFNNGKCCTYYIFGIKIILVMLAMIKNIKDHEL